MNKTAKEQVERLEEFITLHHQYRKAIPFKTRLPKSIDIALDRILQEAIIEKTSWENINTRWL